MARITAYDVMNILFAATIAFFWPCYSIYVFCDSCDGLLSDAGRLVQLMWYPGTVDLNYGARGPGRFNGGKESSEVLRGACVPCPQALLTAVAKGYGPDHNYVGDLSHFGPTGPSGPYTQQLDVSRATCVRVGDVGLKEGNDYILRGPRSMSARDYVLYQLFGPKFQDAFQTLYGPKVYEGTGTRNPVKYDTHFSARAAQLYNQKLFMAMSPFPFCRGQINTTATHQDHPFLVSGYYIVNGRPFIPPKLWDYISYDNPATKEKGTIISSDASLWTTVPANYKAQYQTSEHMAGQIYVSQGHKQALHGITSSDPAGNQRYLESEWWYPEMCPSKSCGESWYLRTSLQYWTEEHYEDYVQRYFAGGGDVTALWSGGMQTQLPNVTVNANALSRAMNK